MTTSFFLSDIEPSWSTEYDKDDIICGRYRILQKAGTTQGHNKVFYCLDLWDNSPCVLKEMPAWDGKEARKLVTLPSHPNVVKLLRLEVIGGSIFMVLEWMWETLRDRMERPFLSDDITKILSSICSGLHHCIRYLSTEDAPFVHGDLKPENIYVDKNGSAVIADFGGGYTPGYASPEQKARVKFDSRSDIYSIGIILSELCEKVSDVAYRDKNDSIIKWCLQDFPSDRPQSLCELCQALGIKLVEKVSVDPLSIEQLSSMALIGEKFNLFKTLTNVLKTGDSKSLFYAGEILMHINSSVNAVSMYKLSYEKDGNSFALSRLAEAYLTLSDWDNAIKYSMMALTKNPFDLRSFSTSVTAIYSKSIDTAYQKEDLQNYAPDRELYSQILKALKLVQEKQPHQKDFLRISGYIYYILQDFDQAVLCYEKYLAHSKDDYESIFNYAVCLYMTFDTTKALEYFRMTSVFIENSEAVSLRRLVSLLECKYYLKDIDAVDALLTRIEEMINNLSEHDQKTVWMYLMKSISIMNLQADDLDLIQPEFSFIGKTLHRLQSGTEIDENWCKECLRVIDNQRSQWSRFSSMSIAARNLQIVSYNCESALYEQLGQYDDALIACDHILELDHSSFDGLVNKAQCLIRLEHYIEAVPYLRRGFDSTHNEQMRKYVKEKEKEILVFLHQNPDEFYQNLLDKAPMWNGSTAELQRIVSDYGVMFDETILNWLSDYTSNLIDDIIYNHRSPSDIVPLIDLLGVMQQIVVPEPSAWDKEPFEIQITEHLHSIYYLSYRANLIDVSIHILTMLIDAATEYNMSGWLFICLPFRGLAYFDKKGENRSENLSKAIADLKRALEQPESQMDAAIPRIAITYQNIGSCFNERNFDGDLKEAEFYYSAAESLFSDLNDTNALAKNSVFLSICLFKQKRFQEAASYAQRALEFFTIQNDPGMFAEANLVYGAIATYYVGMGNMSLISSGIKAYNNCLSVYKADDPNRYEALMKLSFLLNAQENEMHDGSGLLARYYLREVPSNIARDFADIKTYLDRIYCP